MTIPGWTPEQDKLLTALVVEAKISYNEAAGIINRSFRTNFSRNAAIGRGKRIGLCAPRKIVEKPVMHQKPSEPKAAPLPRPPRRPARLKIVPPAIEEPQEPVNAPIACDPVPFGAFNLVDLEINQCRFPFGEGPILFCGASCRDGDPYCTEHMRLTRRSAEEQPKGERVRAA